MKKLIEEIEAAVKEKIGLDKEYPEAVSDTLEIVIDILRARQDDVIFLSDNISEEEAIKHGAAYKVMQLHFAYGAWAQDYNEQTNNRFYRREIKQSK